MGWNAPGTTPPAHSRWSARRSPPESGPAPPPGPGPSCSRTYCAGTRWWTASPALAMCGRACAARARSPSSSPGSGCAASPPPWSSSRPGTTTSGCPARVEQQRVGQAIALIRTQAPHATIALITVFTTRTGGFARQYTPAAAYRTDHAIVAAAVAADHSVIIMDPLAARWAFSPLTRQAAPLCGRRRVDRAHGGTGPAQPRHRRRGPFRRWDAAGLRSGIPPDGSPAGHSRR